MRPTSRTFVGAASPLAGADPVPGPGTVAQVFTRGFYALDAAGRIVPVLGARALRLPTGILVPALDADDLLGLRSGTPIQFSNTGSGPRMRIADLTIATGRRWAPARVALAPTVKSPPAMEPPAASHRTGVEALPGLVRTLATQLLAPETACNRVATAAAVRALVGLGPGSTPSGDDALCGAALALRCLGHGRRLARLRRAVSPLLHRTSPFSASLLAAALDGWCLPQTARLIALVCRPRSAGALCTADRPTSSGELLELADQIGSTSGHDLLAGATGLAAAHSSQAGPAVRVA